jgi:type IV secretion system protein VirB9
MRASTALLAGALIILTGALPCPTLALEMPRSGSKDSRVRFVDYDPYNVVQVVGSLRSSVQVEFSSDEEIAHVALGNTVAWEVAPAGHILFLKARENQPLTNLQVVTTRRDGSKRSYQLELTTREGQVGTGSGTFFYVKFRYPGDEAEARRLAAAAQAEGAQARHADTVLAAHERFGPRNWRYSAQGSGAIEPASVYDNGKVTTLTFAGNAEVPAIYIVNSDGSESLVPKSVEGNLVLVHAIAPKLVLRRGGDVLCLFNEGWTPEGINPGSGTTSPSVVRQVRTGVPRTPKAREARS